MELTVGKVLGDQGWRENVSVRESSARPDDQKLTWLSQYWASGPGFRQAQATDTF